MLFILLYINPFSLLIIRASSFLEIILRKNFFIMDDTLYEIDSAMNMIKEDVIRELSESVSKQNKKAYYRQTSSNNLSFSDKSLD